MTFQGDILAKFVGASGERGDAMDTHKRRGESGVGTTCRGAPEISPEEGKLTSEKEREGACPPTRPAVIRLLQEGKRGRGARVHGTYSIGYIDTARSLSLSVTLPNSQSTFLL